MDDQLELKQNETGEVVQVVTTTQTNEIPISSTELQRQIDEHQAIVTRLQLQYDVVKSFEDSLPKPPVAEEEVIS